MTTRRTRPALPTPGDTLRNLLEEVGVSQERLAAALGVSRINLNQVINGRRTVTPDMAIRLSRALSTTPDFWLNLQREVDLDEASRRLAKTLKSIPVVRRPLPNKDLFYEASKD
jgi:addiction module HigA family antidote